jgi:hypothetical protein
MWGFALGGNSPSKRQPRGENAVLAFICLGSFVAFRCKTWINYAYSGSRVARPRTAMIHGQESVNYVADIDGCKAL